MSDLRDGRRGRDEGERRDDRRSDGRRETGRREPGRRETGREDEIEERARLARTSRVADHPLR
ncbi:hypothetical protein [Streptomyces sp. NPDC002403]